MEVGAETKPVPGAKPAKLRGRPRVKASFETLLKYRRGGMGWRLAASTYTEKTGEFISASTVRRIILNHNERSKR